MHRLLLLFILGITAVPFAQAEPGMITKSSHHSVATTMDRLEAALKEKGIALVARVDHAAGAKKVDMALKPAQLLIFGNPKLGTPLMQSNPQIGLDLPLRVLAWEDAAGKVWVGYTAPADLAARYRIGNRAEVVQKMTGVLDQLTTQATQP
jgi:uncharacterized protein (DUF302 family)